MSGADGLWQFLYDVNGMRTLRTDYINYITYRYVYNGSQLTQMSKNNDTLFFAYDAAGKPLSFTYGTATYYYVTNLQGDVVAILDSTGTPVVSYTYNAWGKVLSVTGSMAATLGRLNPLTYRGYVYDWETGLYYLQSRYYNPEWGRFINADAFASTGGLLGNNMFAYCGNDPVNRVDPTGHHWMDIIQTFVAAVTTAFNAVIEAAKKICNSESKPGNSTVTIPEGGETVFTGQVRICTDGSDGTKVPDDYWYGETALYHDGEPLDAYTVYYVVVPMDQDQREDLLGCSALLINHDTGMSVWCVVGDQGPSSNGWGEVSIAAIWDTGNPDHMTANTAYGLGSNYEIILYRDIKYDFGD